MTTARITAVMLDGTKHEATGVYMPLADRVAFERKYAETLGQIRKQAKEAGSESEPDFSGVKDEQVAFFCWRLLRRGQIPVGEFEDFLENADELAIDVQDGPADPTDAGPPLGNSPS